MSLPNVEELAKLRCHGLPWDCMGWRQFVIERICPEQELQIGHYGVRVSKVVLFYPLVVWVSSEAHIKAYCQHKQFAVHPSSIDELVDALRYERSDGTAYACEASGQFLD